MTGTEIWRAYLKRINIEHGNIRHDGTGPDHGRRCRPLRRPAMICFNALVALLLMRVRCRFCY